MPEGYFESFSDKLQGRIAEDMPGLPREAGFKVPNGYFDAFNDTLFQKLRDKEVKVFGLQPFRKFYLAAAIIALLIIGALTFTLISGPKQAGELSFETLALADLEYYFETADMDFTNQEIIELLPMENLEVSDILEDEFDQENIIEYLDNSIEDFEELNLENDD